MLFCVVVVLCDVVCVVVVVVILAVVFVFVSVVCFIIQIGVLLIVSGDGKEGRTRCMNSE